MKTIKSLVMSRAHMYMVRYNLNRSQAMQLAWIATKRTKFIVLQRVG